MSGYIWEYRNWVGYVAFMVLCLDVSRNDLGRPTLGVKIANFQKFQDL